jgi:putative membrane protein
MMGWYGHWPMMGWFGGFGMILLLAVLIGMVLLVLRATRAGQTSPGDPAETALRRRYAAGEIDRAEFEETRRALGLAEQHRHEVL